MQVQGRTAQDRTQVPALRCGTMRALTLGLVLGSWSASALDNGLGDLPRESRTPARTRRDRSLLMRAINLTLSHFHAVVAPCVHSHGLEQLEPGRLRD